MCSLNEFEHDDFETDVMPRDRITSVNNVAESADVKSVCKVCGSKEIQVSLRNKNEYCKVCFLPILTHKFKATLGKSKVVRSTDSVLIAHSGKVNSTVLVHLIKANVNETSCKKIPFQCKVLYIDDGLVKKRTIEERQFIRNALVKEAESTQLLTYIVPLSKYTSDNIFEEIQPVNVPGINITRDDVAIQEIFNGLESDTARDELLRQLRRRLLVSAARSLNCNKVFLADTSVDLAVKVLGNISTGRGSQLPFDVAFSDTRCADVTLLRPLKDFTVDDVSGYLDCCKLCPIITSQKDDHSFSASIRTVARSFVCQLDSEFYGTVPTIYRTSEKLTARLGKLNNPKINIDIESNIDDNTCILCETVLNSCCSQDGQLSVVRAKLFSKLVSTTFVESSSSVTDNEETKSKYNVKQEKCYCLGNPLQKQSLQSYIIKKYLCYSCSLIFLHSNQTHITLPNFMLNTIQQKLHSMRLRDEISDFLL
ncbi:cytoplasmic tRNA 2-thiolation protein 2-A [Osmia bicornis bicornis]|uniref:cytoplasmic tRNA 2-thiolation protein 2-A n=1 Tax=Osmia bicornis bicornis TaxID=1437191 RepID=UPI0010F48D89|nr:cytoplasmic tRNA 2-thiolation protein 2-A [Osmia bicornis bicornis]